MFVIKNSNESPQECAKNDILAGIESNPYQKGTDQYWLYSDEAYRQKLIKDLTNELNS